MEAKHDNSARDRAAAWVSPAARQRDGANALPGMLANTAEQDGSLPKRDDEIGRGAVVLLALRLDRRGVLQ
jgi:hypothetical protein